MSKWFAKVISKQQKSQLARKELKHKLKAILQNVSLDLGPNYLHLGYQ